MILDKSIIDRMEIISKWLLLRLAERAEFKRDIYLRNAIAKNLSLLRSIEKLHSEKQFNQAWILFRSLLDRLVYLYYLNDNNLYEAFDDWTFIKVYEQRNNAKADERFKETLADPLFKSTPEESQRYALLKKQNVGWFKPNPKDVLKSRGMDFLYKFGYDYASMHTHPMSSDGDLEFHQITGLEPNPHSGFTFDELYSNTLLVGTLIHQEIFDGLSFKFMKLCYSFLEELRKEIGSQTHEGEDIFKKLIILIHSRTPLFE